MTYGDIHRHLGQKRQKRAFAQDVPARAELRGISRPLARKPGQHGKGLGIGAQSAEPLKAAPPLNMFVRDVEYRWQVQALDREGHVRLTSPSQPFTVYRSC